MTYRLVGGKALALPLARGSTHDAGAPADPLLQRLVQATSWCRPQLSTLLQKLAWLYMDVLRGCGACESHESSEDGQGNAAARICPAASSPSYEPALPGQFHAHGECGREARYIPLADGYHTADLVRRRITKCCASALSPFSPRRCSYASRPCRSTDVSFTFSKCSLL